jgi:WG containing repeat
LAAVSNAKARWGYIDKNGAVVIPFGYSFAMEFTDGKAQVMKEGKWSSIDKKGNAMKDE